MTDFYQSPEWRSVRKIPLKKYGSKCVRCGSTKNIHVGHIKARSKYPHLALNPKNLAPLCERCNQWQGVRTMDFRRSHWAWGIASEIINLFLVILLLNL